MAKRKPNTPHHNVPTSLGGSNDDVNVTRPKTELHDRFHRWAEHRDPAMLVRYMTLESIGTRYAMSADQVKRVIEITGIPDWTQSYESRTFTSVAVPGAMDRTARVNENRTTLLKQERLMIRRKLIELTNGDEEYEPDQMLIEAMRFFKAKRPQHAIEEFLTKETRKDRYLWSNPLKDKSRSLLLRHATEVDHEISTPGDYLPILTKHADHLDRLVSGYHDEFKKFFAKFENRKI